MRLLRMLGLPVLLLAGALTVGACGGSGAGSGSGEDMQDMDHGGNGQAKQEEAKESDGGMAGMDHSNMDHGSMGSGGMARQMVMENGEYSDRAFIDAMVPHHQGAVDMAEVALENAGHQEIRDLSEDIVSAQEAEIEELKTIKEAEFGTSEVPMKMSRMEMRMMGMTDPQELANKEPFDRAFIDAMIPHHRSAIGMANVALEESDNPEIRDISRAIVDAQEMEIAQMKQWRQQWYPEG
jgi:uncharacterized protein (DUF305 family)